MLRQYIKEQAEELGMFIPGLEIKENPRTSKSYRLESLQPLFANGKVYIQKDMQAFIDECTLYPRGKHDDLLDGFSMQTKIVIDLYTMQKKNKKHLHGLVEKLSLGRYYK